MLMIFGSLEKTNTKAVREKKTIEKPTMATVNPKSTELARKINNGSIIVLFIVGYLNVF
jgi:hypothetical protein